VQLTASETDVVGFAQAQGVVAYYACVPFVERRPLVVRVESFAEALPPMDNNEEGCYQTTPIEFFVQRQDQPAVRVALPPMRLFPHLKRIWIAPNGDYAVILAPAVDAPASWAEYVTPDAEQLGYTARWVRSDATSMDLLNRTRYLLADLRRGTVRPLLGAPSGQASQNFTPPEVFWRKDGQSVIVTNTYLPLDDITGAAREERAARPAIAEVDIASGATSVIEWEPVPRDLQTPVPLPIVAFEWDGEADRLTVISEARISGAVERRSYSRAAASWRRDRIRPTTTASHLVVEQMQALNDRPRVFVADRPAAKRRLLFDPNPGAERLSFATTRVMTWKDSNGTSWTGGLMVPPGYEAGRRYPLVVQTHGFTPSKFLLDGPMYDGQGGTAFAAQAFASAGFIVLQVEDNPATITQDENEGPAVAEGFNAGIAQLVEEGLVDPSRVGLIGFSRTGYHALHLVAQHPALLAALSLSDTLHAGYSIFLYNVNTPASAELSRLTQGKPIIPDVGGWFARNPLYALARSTAAVRLENMGVGLGLWEPYAILKQAGRPVEFVVYPDGSHVLQKPTERLASQGGTVDWFRFWLQGYEDPDVAKSDQYRRWRELRDSHPR
jgi:dienelactone hydrolase